MGWIRVPNHMDSLKANRVQIWAANFASEVECKAFFRQEMWDGVSPYDKFAASQGNVEYLWDNIHCYFQDCESLEEFFWRGVNVNKNAVVEIVKAAEKAGVENSNCIIIYPCPDWYNDPDDRNRLGFLNPKSVKGENFEITFLGQYTSADDLLWANNERSHHWVGYFPSQERFSRFMEESYSDDDDVPMNEFCASQGTTWYDHDWIGASYEPEKSVEDYFNETSWAYGEGENTRLLELALQTGMKVINTYITFYEYSKYVKDEGCPGPRSFSGVDYELVYLGRYRPHKDLLN